MTLIPHSLRVVFGVHLSPTSLEFLQRRISFFPNLTHFVTQQTQEVVVPQEAHRQKRKVGN
jgi:hypothetical protein